MKANVKSAEELFNDTFSRWMRAWAIIWSFREVLEAGLPSAEKFISARKVYFMHSLLTEPVGENLFLVDRKKLIEERWDEKFAAIVTQQALQNARASVDAASLVFAHSVLEANVSDYLRVTALVAPKDWAEEVCKKQVSLGEVQEASFDKLFGDSLEKRLEQLERESLLKKTGVLFARCKPPAKWSPMADYQFDSERLEKLDRLRHDIVHGEALGSAITNVVDELDYLCRSTMFLMGLVNLRYGLRLDPMHGARAAAGKGT